MTTIVEIRGRGGQLLERFRSDAAQISIGRAFDNELILEDPYVSPHHLSLVKAGDGWLINDHDSLNGYEHGSRPGKDGEFVKSGDWLRIGHTELRVYREEHVVAEALPVDGAEIRLARLGRHAVWPVLLFVSLAVFLGQAYLGSFQEFRWLPSLGEQINWILGVGIIAAFWALVGRLLRHRAGFLAHLSIWSLYGICAVLASWLASIAGYNFSSGGVFAALDNVFSFGLQVGALWASLLLATTLTRNWRLGCAVCVSAAFLALGLITTGGSQREFSAIPDYYGEVLQPGFRWAPAAEPAQTAAAVTQLVERVNAEAARLAAEEAQQKKGRRTSVVEGD
ncbi:MAG: FHA domain-containing protein [Chromatiales bacterium]|nr:MAG: FHA domain-containing protein [Chromatiales bacterium]